MPIRVRCDCGHAMAVPDAYAGKTGKCPKCSKPIKIPAATAGSPPGEKAPAPKPSSAKPATASSPAAKPQPKPASKTAATQAKSSGGALDQLFSEAGLDKKTGPVCPSCQAAIPPNTVICTKCGTNLQTGEKLQGFSIASAGNQGPFSNKVLNEADRSLRHEAAADEALRFVGAPWWVYLAYVLGLCMIIAFGAIAVESGTKDEASGEIIRADPKSFRGFIQQLPFLTAALFIATCVSGMVVWLATLATYIAAFKDKVVAGLLCMFLPFYIYYYAITRRAKLGKTAWILLIWTILFIPISIGFFVSFAMNVKPPADPGMVGGP
jgi:hypothetical protein